MNLFKNLFIALFLMSLSTGLMAAADDQEIEPFSDAELEQILAPIALYPDTVLSHILVAATYPLEVIQAERWTDKNPDLQGSDAVEAVDEMDWDPSVKALVAFPQLLKRLSENLEWTQKLGDAFLQDESKLLASVQALRQRAYDSGNLDKMDKVSVTHEDSSIIIEPIEREVVYVPYYDTRVVYGPWYWSHYPPVYWDYPRHSHHRSPFYWGPRIHVSFGFFFSSFHWHNRHLVRIPRHHYRPHHYYNRHQIVRHNHVRRWHHDPAHRRGVSYRSVTVRDRYHSNRASRSEIREHRVNQRDSASSNSSRNQSTTRTNSGSTTRDSNTRNSNSSNRRIATPNRIREELRDGRISVEERNARPANSNSNRETRTNRNSDNSNNRNTDRVRNQADQRETNRSNSRNTTRTQQTRPVKTRQEQTRAQQPANRSTRNNETRTKEPRKEPKPRESRPSRRDNSSKDSNRSRSSSKDSSSKRSTSRKSSSSSNKSSRSRSRDNRS